ncbi:MAG: hypothetical protein NVSMB56_15700 [Pyrinomonadaceae bacterium]
MSNRIDKIEDTDEQGHLKAGYQVEESDAPNSTTNAEAVKNRCRL